MQAKAQKRKEVELWEIRRPVQNTRVSKHGRSSAAASMKRRRARRRKAYFYRTLAMLLVAACLAGIFWLTGVIYRGIHRIQKKEDAFQTIFQLSQENTIPYPSITEDFLEINPYSRPGIALKRVKNIFVHYTANQGTSAAQNRSYFANLAQTGERSASAHFIIGYEGEIIQCIPLAEEAYAVATRNEDSISIECCYLEENGVFTKETYDSLVQLLAWLLGEYCLEPEDILRHYDCGGKLCPLYYVEHEDSWNQLLSDVASYKEAAED